MIKTKTGVLLLNFGAPGSLGEVEDFIAHICRGQKPGEQVLKIMQERYKSIGGSPLNTTTSLQARKLSEELKKQGEDMPVYFGMLHSKPFISQVVAKMVQDGIREIFAISLAPFYSKVSTGAYYDQVRESVEKINPSILVSYSRELFAHPSFGKIWAEKISQSMRNDPDPKETNLIFTAHSLSLHDREDAINYQRQFQEAVKEVQSKLSYRKSYLAYQSKGNRPGNWLGPQVGEVIEKLAFKGEKKLLLIPIGFVTDHMETLYDLDLEVKHQVEMKKMQYRRVPALNNEPAFIKLLASVPRVCQGDVSLGTKLSDKPSGNDV